MDYLDSYLNDVVATLRRKFYFTHITAELIVDVLSEPSRDYEHCLQKFLEFSELDIEEVLNRPGWWGYARRRLFQLLKNPYDREINLTYQHTREDLVTRGVLDKTTTDLKRSILKCEQVFTGAAAGKTLSYILYDATEEGRGQVMSGVQITGNNYIHLLRIIKSIRQIRLDIGGNTYDIPGILLRLKLYLYQNQCRRNGWPEPTSLPIFEGFCQRDRPHNWDDNRYHLGIISVEIVPESEWTDKMYESLSGMSNWPPLFQATFESGTLISNNHQTVRFVTHFTHQSEAIHISTGSSGVFRSKTSLYYPAATTYILFLISTYKNSNEDVDQANFLDLIEDISLDIDGYTCFDKIPGNVLSHDLPRKMGLVPMPQGKAYYLLPLSNVSSLWGVPHDLSELYPVCEHIPPPEFNGLFPNRRRVTLEITWKRSEKPRELCLHYIKQSIQLNLTNSGMGMVIP